MKQVDTILHCRWIIPIEPFATVLEHHSIMIEHGKIIALLPTKEAEQQYQSDDTHVLDTHAVLPGFVNGHTHSPMVLFRGLADDLPLMEWLTQHIWPAEVRWLSDEFITDGTELAVAEMIRSGTTCFNEHFFFPEPMANVALQAKIRACIGPTIINFPNNWSTNEEDAFHKAKEFYEKYQEQKLMTVSMAPHAPYTTTNKILEKITLFAADHDLTMHMHVHETETEINESLAQYGKRPLERLHEIGMLSPRFQCVHMTQMNEDDFKIVKETGSHIIHCQESNLKLASGYCPVNSLLQEGINVAIGTDGAASNNDLNMIGEMRSAALVGKLVAKDATAVSAYEVLRMATLNTAKAMGLDHRIGSIKPGKEADLIAIDLNHCNTLPMYNPVSQIVYSASRDQVTDVWIAGNPVLRDKTLLTIDQSKLIHNATKWHSRIAKNGQNL